MSDVDSLSARAQPDEAMCRILAATILRNNGWNFDADQMSKGVTTNHGGAMVLEAIKLALSTLSTPPASGVTEEMVERAASVLICHGEFTTLGAAANRHCAKIAARAALEAASLPVPATLQGWRDVSTAPRGKAVLVWKSNTQEQYVAALIDGGHGPGWCDQSGCEIFKVTHWQPLPTPPTKAGT
jgi:hypothetical protein